MVIIFFANLSVHIPSLVSSIDFEELPNTHIVGWESDEGDDKRGTTSVKRLVK